MDDADNYARAKTRVRQIKGFYIHATVYVLVNAFLLITNFISSRGTIWFVWPLFGWGIGLVAHGIAVFGLRGLWGPEWEERKIKELIEKNRSR
jgi:carbon starvation protein CstA